MPAYLIGYRRPDAQLLEVVEFPSGEESSAELNRHMRELRACAGVEYHVFYASSLAQLAAKHFFAAHDEANPAPYRMATEQELALNTLEKLNAARRQSAALNERSNG